MIFAFDGAGYDQLMAAIHSGKAPAMARIRLAASSCHPWTDRPVCESGPNGAGIVNRPKKLSASPLYQARSTPRMVPAKAMVRDSVRS